LLNSIALQQYFPDIPESKTVWPQELMAEMNNKRKRNR
jgi:hypothetical protein